MKKHFLTLSSLPRRYSPLVPIKHTLDAVVLLLTMALCSCHHVTYSLSISGGGNNRRLLVLCVNSFRRVEHPCEQTEGALLQWAVWCMVVRRDGWATGWGAPQTPRPLSLASVVPSGACWRCLDDDLWQLHVLQPLGSWQPKRKDFPLSVIISKCIHSTVQCFLQLSEVKTSFTSHDIYS